MKKFAVVCLALLLVCVFCGCVDNTAANRSRSINSVNHRGYCAAPENTLAAFRLSKEKGFDMVECDVSFTKDGQPVLLHDSSVDRTSNGKGEIRSFTLNEVRKLDFGSWKGAEYQNEKIPTFQEFLNLCVELELHPYVEIKNGATADEVNLLAQIVIDVGIDVTWISFNYDILTQLSEIFESGRFGLVVTTVTEDNVQLLLRLSNKSNSVFMDCNYRTVTSAQIELCKYSNIPLEVWTINSPERIANIDPYISGVTSDNVHAEQLFATL